MRSTGRKAAAARQIWQRYGDFVDDLVLASDVVPAATLGEMAAIIRQSADEAGNAAPT